jgi:hypothetical protein
MTERIQIAAKLLASHVVLIICLIILSIITKKDAFLFISISQTILIILYFSGYWEFFGLRFKKYFSGLVELTLISVFVWKLNGDLNWSVNLYLVLSLSLIQVYLLFELIKVFLVIKERNRNYLDIEFPFKYGSFLVTDGGNSRLSRLMNYHYYSPTHRKNKTNNSMLYATDIVKLQGLKSKFLPISNSEYPIFNEEIYSPIDGVVVKVENSISDNQPFEGNYPYNTGNTVVIKKDNYYLLLGHLKKGSITVKEGDVVRSSDLIGLVGNSGWTERPHLHMQLIESKSGDYWHGKGVCIRHDKRNLYKNRIIQI